VDSPRHTSDVMGLQLGFPLENQDACLGGPLMAALAFTHCAS